MRAGWFMTLLFLSLPQTAIAQGRPGPTIETSTLMEAQHPLSVVEWRDWVFKETRRYSGYWLADVVARIPGSRTVNPRETELIFHSQDGYDPLLQMDRLSERRGFLVLSNTPSGHGWVKAGPHAVDPGPAYLIWENPLKNEDESGFPWPYQVVRIEMLSKTAVMKALQPPGLTGVDTGAALFRDRCLKCHNSHGVGGTMGPDLRAMLKTVGDWKAEKLALFIQHPKKVIPASKMADMAHLSQAALSSIVDYLRAIKTNQL